MTSVLHVVLFYIIFITRTNVFFFFCAVRWHARLWRVYTEEERTTRRISYLKATTWGDRMSVDDLSAVAAAAAAAATESESEPTSMVVAQQK